MCVCVRLCKAIHKPELRLFYTILCYFGELPPTKHERRMVGAEGWTWSKMNLAKSSCSQWLTSDSESRQLENVICTTMPMDDIDVMATSMLFPKRVILRWIFPAFPLFCFSSVPEAICSSHDSPARSSCHSSSRNRLPPSDKQMEVPTICLRLEDPQKILPKDMGNRSGTVACDPEIPSESLISHEILGNIYGIYGIILYGICYYK